MLKDVYKVIGVMSGTSLDGIDLAYLSFTYNSIWRFNVVYAETIKYSSKWTVLLQNLVSYSSGKLKQIDTNYTLLLSETINDFIARNSIKEIDAICSHGHTALHEPKKGLTYQIGNQHQLAVLTNNIVVCDFRVQDVEYGGQGAPLVPIGDRLLFPKYEFCVNLGGFANISFEENSHRTAYDICPVNIVLNHFAKQLGCDYDNKGKIASTGRVNAALLQQLNNLSFYKLKHPKSLGLEWVNKNIFPLIDSFELEIKNILRTFIEHIAVQISNEINKKEKASVLVTGGGVFNVFLINRIKALTTHEIVLPSNDIINYKEAIIFGLLGILKLRNQVNCLCSVTGAKKDHSSGTIFYE